MSALPRADCPICGRNVPVRRNGAFREHNAFDSPGAPAYSKCVGSGKKLAGDCESDCQDGCAYPGLFTECEIGATE